MLKVLVIAVLLAWMLVPTRAASCKGSIMCDYHNVYAFLQRTEVKNGKLFGYFAHGTGSSRHEIQQVCN